MIQLYTMDKLKGGPHNMHAPTQPTQVANTTTIATLHVGLGPIGLAAAKLAAQRSSLRAVGAIDVAPALQGTSLADLIGITTSGDIVIQSDIPEAQNHDGRGVAIHATSSSLEKCVDQLITLAQAGWNVVSSCEELSYPWRTQPEIAKRLDAAATEAGVVIVGTGVNPGYAMDYLPLALTSTLRHVRHVSVLRVQDAGGRRLPLQKKVGAGLTREEFEQRAGAKTIRHVGLLESVQLLADALGFNNADCDETVAPIIAESPTPSGLGPIAAGHVLGVHQVATASENGTELVKLELQMAVGLPRPRDEVSIAGDPDVHMVVPSGFHGDSATEAMLVNTIATAIHASPGLRVMSELPPPRPFT